MISNGVCMGNEDAGDGCGSLDLVLDLQDSNGTHSQTLILLFELRSQGTKSSMKLFLDIHPVFSATSIKHKNFGNSCVGLLFSFPARKL